MTTNKSPADMLYNAPVEQTSLPESFGDHLVAAGHVTREQVREGLTAAENDLRAAGIGDLVHDVVETAFNRNRPAEALQREQAMRSLHAEYGDQREQIVADIGRYLDRYPATKQRLEATGNRWSPKVVNRLAGLVRDQRARGRMK